MPCTRGMAACRPLCGHREMVRAYHVARNADRQRVESVAGGGWAARDDEDRPGLLTFKEWLKGQAVPEEWRDE